MTNTLTSETPLKLNLFIASDHAGFELKKQLVDFLKTQSAPYTKNLEISDLGPFTTDSVDYPDYADQVCKKMLQSNENSFGVLICGSGQGMSLRANKYPHIRAALVYNDEITKLSREHNNANVICMGSRFCTLEQAKTWLEIFITTAFAGGRHANRVNKIEAPLGC